MVQREPASPGQDSDNLTVLPIDIANTMTEFALQGGNRILKLNRDIRSLIFDFVLATSIVGLFPVHTSLWGYSRLADVLSNILLALLNLVMIREIGKRWGYPKGQDTVAIVGSVLGVFGAFFAAILARVVVLALGLIFPWIIIFNSAVAYGLLTWLLGRLTHQFYLSSKQLDLATWEQQVIQANQNEV